MARLRHVVPEGASVYQYAHDFFPALFYADRDLGRAIAKGAPIPVDSYLIVEEDELTEIQERFPAYKVLLISDGFANDGVSRLFVVRIVGSDRKNGRND